VEFLRPRVGEAGPRASETGPRVGEKAFPTGRKVYPPDPENPQAEESRSGGFASDGRERVGRHQGKIRWARPGRGSLVGPARRMPGLLSIGNVSKSYRKGEIKAVDDLTLEVPAGEIYGFLGPNGAGKTTTIKMVVGLLRPDRGTITVDGIDVLANPIEAKRRIGFVPDYPELYEKLTGVEYLNFIGDVFGVPTDLRRKRLQELLEMFELQDAVRDLIQTFSHGMRQKLAVISAVLPDPALLILDEPMTGLDPRSAALFKELMRRRCDQGKAVFFSTHILDVAERVCDRIAIINHGRLVAQGTMEELRHIAAGETTLEEIFLDLTEEKG
jgi:ABC-2 type transport system ATP-binding protein